MTVIYTSKSDNLDLFLETTGVKAAPASADERDPLGKTLVAGTYYAPIGASEALLPGTAIMVAIQAKWNAALAATLTIEACNFPSAIEGVGHGRADVTDFEATAAQNWIQENDAAAGRGYSAGGGGNVLTILTMVAGGANAGAVNLYLNNAASRRYRLKVVVTTPGLLRVGACGKE
jgi:hypothetical protein